VRLADGAKMLFDGVDLTLEPRVRACLVGRNGAGKSTLLKILAGSVEPDGGERTLTPGARMALVDQEPEITGETLLAYASAGGAPAHAAAAALEAFGLDPERGTLGLSGGEIRRAALARAFSEAPDVLLLDEPTNHLDIQAIETLEAMVLASRSAVLIISHDRRFLERTTQRCFWLESRTVRRRDGGFDGFDAWADEIADQEVETARRLDKAIDREQRWMDRGVTGRRARNEGRRRKLLALRAERRERRSDERSAAVIEIDSGGRSGVRVIEAKGLTKTYGERTLFKDFSTRILRGDRVAVVGPNGAGKTTLVRVLLGEIAPDTGTVKLGTGLTIAYADQNRASLEIGDTLWTTLAPDGGDQILVRGRPRHVAAYAKDFQFTEAQLRQPTTSLSGGERNRLVLALALARPANLMILDEPTNDLDMETLELLEDLLADYDGTLILISHDRDFIDRLASSTIALNGRGQIVETPGGWRELTDQNPGFFAAPVVAPARQMKMAPTSIAAKSTKLSFKDQRRLEEAEAQMPVLAARIAEVEEKLADPSLYSRDRPAFEKLMAALDAHRANLAKAEEDWLTLEEKRQGLANGGAPA